MGSPFGDARHKKSPTSYAATTMRKLELLAGASVSHTSHCLSGVETKGVMLQGAGCTAPSSFRGLIQGLKESGFRLKTLNS